MTQRVLCVVAHPDDEIGCVGTLARWQAQGRDVAVAYLGTGRPGGDQVQAAMVLQEQRHWRAYWPRSHRPDNAFDLVGVLDLAQEIERWVAEWQPHTLVTHHAGDLNVDHRLVHQAVVTATRPLPGSSVRDVLAFEVLSSTEWAFDGGSAPFCPTVFIDITSTFDQKLAALACYQSEARPWPHPHSPEALTARAHYWGSVVGCAAAEPFMLIRSVR